MILKSVYIYIGELGLPPDYTYSFTKRSRFICNWLEREVLQPLRFDTQNFNRIVVVLCSVPKPETYTNTSKVACAEIGFERNVVDSAEGKALAKLQIAMLRAGIEKRATFLVIPKTELLHGLDLFEQEGMRNEWLHRKRVFLREHGLSAVLSCKMTQDLFSLWLTVVREGATVFSGAILETEPDEVVFRNRFKDIELDNGNLVVTAKIGPSLWTKPLVELKTQVRPA